MIEVAGNKDYKQTMARQIDLQGLASKGEFAENY